LDRLEPQLNLSPTPELRLNDVERNELATVVAMGGFRVLQKIMRSAVDKFIMATINANDDREVLNKHKLAKSAAQFYTQVVSDVNEELFQTVNAPKPTDKPVDVTAGIFDIGEMATEDTVGGEENEF
jgi:hypothetical protein